MTQYQILYWKELPAQIKVYEKGKRPLSRVLPERFQQEIDRVAMREGLTGTDAYLEQWHWGPKQERAGTAEEVADEIMGEFCNP